MNVIIETRTVWEFLFVMGHAALLEGVRRFVVRPCSPPETKKTTSAMSSSTDHAIFSTEVRHLRVSHDALVTSGAARAFAVGAAIAHPALIVDASAPESATGVSVASASAGAGAAVSVVSPGVNESLIINAKGGGNITLGSVSTGSVVVGSSLDVGGGGISVSSGGLMVTAGGASISGGLSVADGVASFTDGAKMPTGRIISGAETILVSEAGAIFGVNQAVSADYTITLPAAEDMVGMTFKFVLVDDGDKIVTFSIDQAFVGSIINASAGVTSKSGNTLTCAAGASRGDYIEFTGLTAGLVAVRAFSSASGGIS